MGKVTRREFWTAGAAAYAIAQMPMTASAGANGPIELAATSRIIEVNRRAAKVLGLLQPDGRQGLVLDPGAPFRVSLENRLDRPTSIHWHGQIPPNDQDGVPDLPRPALMPGERRAYDFVPMPGTHWMHSHFPAQEMKLLTAPFIVRAPEDLRVDRQEVVLFLNDFSFKSPDEIMAEVTRGHGGHRQGAHRVHAPVDPVHPMGHRHGVHGHVGHGSVTMPTEGVAMDLNDYDWDAYLANDRTLADPEVIRVERGGRVRLRVVNAASATVFLVDTGAAMSRLVAVDGHDVHPIVGHRFGVAMGQRIDLDVDLPATSGAWPILALREGGRERTGIVLATRSAEIRRLESVSTAIAPAFDLDLAQEARLVAVKGVPARPVDNTRTMTLGGSMEPYVWTIDGKTWGEHGTLRAKAGQRVEIAFHNASMMGHPIHVHGHVFQVVEINGRRISGAMRDTIYVPPMAKVKISLDAGEVARWMLHCHHIPHLIAGMMTVLDVNSEASEASQSVTLRK